MKSDEKWTGGKVTLGVPWILVSLFEAASSKANGLENLTSFLFFSAKYRLIALPVEASSTAVEIAPNVSTIAFSPSPNKFWAPQSLTWKRKENGYCRHRYSGWRTSYSKQNYIFQNGSAQVCLRIAIAKRSVHYSVYSISWYCESADTSQMMTVSVMFWMRQWQKCATKSCVWRGGQKRQSEEWQDWVVTEATVFDFS